MTQPGSPYFEGGDAWESYGDELERMAADMWRRDNPDTSVFLCDAATKEKYRKLACGAVTSHNSPTEAG